MKSNLSEALESLRDFASFDFFCKKQSNMIFLMICVTLYSSRKKSRSSTFFRPFFSASSSSSSSSSSPSASSDKCKTVLTSYQPKLQSNEVNKHVDQKSKWLKTYSIYVSGLLFQSTHFLNIQSLTSQTFTSLTLSQRIDTPRVYYARVDQCNLKHPEYMNPDIYIRMHQCKKHLEYVNPSKYLDIHSILRRIVFISAKTPRISSRGKGDGAHQEYVNQCQLVNQLMCSTS